MNYWLAYHALAAVLVGRRQSEVSMDPERLYVTGLSMGGMGSWAMLARFPNLIATGVPICCDWYFTPPDCTASSGSNGPHAFMRADEKIKRPSSAASNVTFAPFWRRSTC